MSKITVKRIYAPSDPDDGARILVDRLWPRGISKAKSNIDLWLKDISPSDDLRKRFHARPESWDAFRSAYAEELKGETAQAAAAELRALLEKGPITLLYAARDEQQNNAVALKEWLEGHD